MAFIFGGLKDLTVKYYAITFLGGPIIIRPVGPHFMKKKLIFQSLVTSKLLEIAIYIK